MSKCPKCMTELTLDHLGRTACVTCLTDEVVNLITENERLRKIAEKNQWAWDPERMDCYCNCCHRWKSDGHDRYCLYTELAQQKLQNTPQQ